VFDFPTERKIAFRELHRRGCCTHATRFGNAMFDAILNNALAARRSYYGVGDPRCPPVPTYGRYGDRTGRVHTCELPPRISNGVIEMNSRRLIVGDEDRR
jgi:hypothetical protein